MKSIIVVLALVTGCCGASLTEGKRTDRFPDGSTKDDAPVMADELEGTWCSANGTDRMCLTVVQGGVAEAHSGPSKGIAYTWVMSNAQGPYCIESGELTGGLEFTPGNGSCLGATGEIYSASVDWSSTGVDMYVDGGFDLRMAYQDN